MLKKCAREVDTVNSISMLTLIEKFFVVKNKNSKTGW